MRDTVHTQSDLEKISALMDGACLDAHEAADALRLTAEETGCERWHIYHVVGDVLRSSELAACAHDHQLLTRLRAELRTEVRPSQPSTAPEVSITTVIDEVAEKPRHAANDDVFRWKVAAGLASFAAVAVIGWSAFSGVSDKSSEGLLVRADMAPVSTPQQRALVKPVSPTEPAMVIAAQNTDTLAEAHEDNAAVMLRDPRLDEMLAAHRQATGASALGNASGFLRNATFEGSVR